MSYYFRNENCFARNQSSVLEMSMKAYESMRVIMVESNLRKDLTILESLLKRNFIIKKGY